MSKKQLELLKPAIFCMMNWVAFFFNRAASKLYKSWTPGNSQGNITHAILEIRGSIVCSGVQYTHLPQSSSPMANFRPILIYHYKILQGQQVYVESAWLTCRQACSSMDTGPPSCGLRVPPAEAAEDVPWCAWWLWEPNWFQGFINWMKDATHVGKWGAPALDFPTFSNKHRTNMMLGTMQAR